MKTRLLGVLVLVAWLSSPALGDFDRGLAAANQGDYATAAVEWRVVAEEGDSIAQHTLALMYYQGLGVPQDYTEAARWFRAAAEQGDAASQTYLGHMYSDGLGVPRNLVLTYKWESLAAAQGDEMARKHLRITEKQMTPEQVAEAQRLAAEAWERMKERE